jgi:hypothetical protein
MRRTLARLAAAPSGRILFALVHIADAIVRRRDDRLDPIADRVAAAMEQARCAMQLEQLFATDARVVDAAAVAHARACAHAVLVEVCETIVALHPGAQDELLGPMTRRLEEIWRAEARRRERQRKRRASATRGPKARAKPASTASAAATRGRNGLGSSPA